MEDLVAIGGFLVALAAVAGAIGIIARSDVLGRPFRWLWKTNISQPIGEWNRGIVGDVVDTRVSHLMSSEDGGTSPLFELNETVRSIDGRMGRVEDHLKVVATDLHASQVEIATELLRSQAEIADELRTFRATSGQRVNNIESGVSELLDHDDERDVPGLRFESE